MGESGGQDNPTSRITRTEGSKGTLQFLPATFKTYGDRYLGGKALNGQDLDINDPSHQRLVAYKYIEDKYNQKNPDGTRKYTAGDIVASWNAGEGRIQSWQNHRGVNQYGNAYDTPAYVAKVGQFYNAIKAQNPPQTSSPTVGQEPDNVAQAGINFAKDVFAGITRPAESIKNAATTYGGAAVSTLLGNMFGDKGATFDDYVNMNKRNLAENSLTQALGGEAPNNPDLSTLKGYGQLAGDIGQTAFNVAGGGVAKGAAKTVAEDAAAKYLSKFAPGLLKSAGLGYGYDVSSNLSDTGDATDWGTYKPGVGLGVGLALPLTSGAVRAAFTPLQKLQEDAFISGVSDLRNRTKTTENSFTKNTIVRPQADGTKQVITPLDNWFSNKIPLPEVSTEGGTAKVKTLLPGGPVETIQKYIDTLDDKTLQEAIGSGLQLNTQDIKAVANKIVNDSYIQDVANGKLKRSDVLSKVQDRLDNLTEEYSKNGVWDGESIRKALKSANRDYSDETKDITRLVGDTMRDILYTQTPTGKQNLGALQELYSMQNFARDIDGKVVTGGGLGRYMARMLGAMVGNNLPGSGAFGLGPIIGSVIGDKAQKAIQKASFTSAPAELKGLVQKLKNLGASDKDIEEYIYKPYSSKADIVPINKQTAKNAATNITNPDTIDKANQATAEQSLIQEAKKYKSAEEFIKAQPTVYHGTNTKFDVFDKSKIGEVTGVGDWGDGFYFSDNKDVAKSFAKDAGGDIVMEVSLKNLKFADGNKLEKLPEVQDILDDGMGFTDIGEYLKSKGYDGVKYKHKEGGGTEYVVYDADKIKTKSQLTDIWNKANDSMNGILPQPTAGVNTQSVDIPQNQSLRDFLLKKQPYVPEQYVPDNKLPVIDFGPKAKSKYTQDVNKDLPVIRSLVGLGTVGAAGIAGLNQTEAATQDSAQSRSQLDNDATTTIGKVKIPSKDNPLYSAYDNEISNAEGLVKSKLGITLPKGLVKTIIATESGFGTDDRSYNPKLGQNAWLVGLTADAKKELANRLKGDYGVDPALINSDTIQGAINSAALYIALKSRVSKGQDSTGSKIIDDVVQKQLLSDPVKLYSTKYSNRSKDAQKAFETRYKYIKEN